jgi:hypothetical protein
MKFKMKLKFKEEYTPVAQRLAQSAHNALVAGSNPAGSTKKRKVIWK